MFSLTARSAYMPHKMTLNIFEVKAAWRLLIRENS